jgi:hypothetical protein
MVRARCEGKSFSGREVSHLPQWNERKDPRHLCAFGDPLVKAIYAVWKCGQIVPVQPVDWPEGTSLSVMPIGPETKSDSDNALLGDDPASIAGWIEVFDALPALQMTSVEEDQWRAARKDMKEHSLARMSKPPISAEP